MRKIEKSLITNSCSWKPSLHNGFLERSNSWFSLRKKQYKSLTEPVKSIRTEFTRCEMVKISPTQKQRHILLTWFEINRLAYNLTVKKLRKNNKAKKYAMRDMIKNDMRNNKYLYNLQKKSGVHQQTLDFSVFDVFKARKTAFSNLKLKNIKHFRIRYKKKSHHLKTMLLNHTAFNKDGTGFKNSLLKDLKPSEMLKPTQSTRLGYNARTKQFTFYVPYPKITETTVKREKVCALDPGIRTFQTLYSPSGVTYQFGDENNIIRKSISKIENVRNLKEKKWYKKYVNRLRVKLKNRIKDMHWKVSNFLCKNFDTILVGNMSTTGIVKKSLHLHSSTKRLTYALSHFLFKDRLKSKADEYGCKVLIVDESYTSKTCGGCGEILKSLGSSKEFNCDKYGCFYRMHRDIHGARNIYIKNLSKIK